MEIRVLGCYGGEAPGHRTTCFLINSRVAIDAGAVTGALSLKDQVRVDAVILTHSHLDHVRDLAFLADNIFGKRDKPVIIYGLPETIREVRNHILNNSVWPDFTRIPNAEHPILAYQEIREGAPVEIEGLKVTVVKVNHTIPTAGFIVENATKSFAISGDTGPTDALWNEAKKHPELAALFLETSFPSRMSELAELTGHLTPTLARQEFAKLNRPDLPVHLYHMKPQFLKEIMGEMDGSTPTLRVARQGDHIEI
jgi:ribonuclease BN (tRNA processing enzyme)